MAMSGGPYGKKTMSKTRVKEAERASRLFWFDKKEMRFFRKSPTHFAAGVVRGDLCGGTLLNPA